MLKIAPFNVKLQSRILQLGYKNYEVAFACDMHEADLSRIVNGRCRPTEEQKKLLCEFLRALPKELDL